jgi:hypothetical protein
MKTILFLAAAFLFVSTVDYYDRQELKQLRQEASEREAERQRALPYRRPAEVAHCPDGWVVTYADAGPKLVRCG